MAFLQDIYTALISITQQLSALNVNQHTVFPHTRRWSKNMRETLEETLGRWVIFGLVGAALCAISPALAIAVIVLIALIGVIGAMVISIRQHTETWVLVSIIILTIYLSASIILQHT